MCQRMYTPPPPPHTHTHTHREVREREREGTPLKTPPLVKCVTVEEFTIDIYNQHESNVFFSTAAIGKSGIHAHSCSFSFQSVL